MSETPQYSDQPYVAPSPVSLPPENVQRGTVLALVIIPAGIIVWTLLWSVGFIASIVAFGVAFGALALYRFGSGGAVGRNGAIRVTVITIVTLLLAFVAGLASDGLPIWMQQHRQTLVESLADPQFWSALSRAAANGSTAVAFLLALVFGALGCFSVLRAAFAQTRAAQAAAGMPGAYGQPGQPAPYGQPAQYGQPAPPAVPPRLMQDPAAPGVPPIPAPGAQQPTPPQVAPPVASPDGEQPPRV